MIKTPRELGYRMPAEWEPHEATWLIWPHNEESWPGKLEKIPPIWVEMIRHLTSGEKVHLILNDAEMEENAKTLLQRGRVNLAQVVFHQWPTNDSWMRDCGPVFVSNSPPPPLRLRGGERGSYDLAVINWEFNKWGGKYPPWDLDNEIPRKVAQYLDVPIFNPGIILEGGSIEVNGRGTLLTTESCLLNKNRNPHLSKREIEQYLSDYLGVTNILWLGNGIAGDDTDGHVDDLSRFVNETTVVTVVEEDPADENFRPLQDNLKRLRTMKDQDGQLFKIVSLPMPRPAYFEGQRLPASYANFYIANRVVFVPVFNDPNDQKALAILSKCFPGHKVVGIDATDLVWGLGGFHCITQQQPA